jgi:hypothetical protein
VIFTDRLIAIIVSVHFFQPSNHHTASPAAI